MNAIYIANKYSYEADLVFINHIASIYKEQDTVVVRLDNGHRIYTCYKSMQEAYDEIKEAITHGIV